MFVMCDGVAAPGSAVLPRAKRVDGKRKRGISGAMVTRTHSWLWGGTTGKAWLDVPVLSSGKPGKAGIAQASKWLMWQRTRLPGGLVVN